MRIAIGIPTVPSRKAGLEKLLASLGEPEGAVVRIFGDREPNWVWSQKMWQWAAETEAEWFLQLQDDVTVDRESLFALIAALDNSVWSLAGLHTCHPAAMSLAREGYRYCTTADGLVGVAYAMRVSALRELVDFPRKLKPRAIERLHEDDLINAFALYTHRRIVHPIPSPIEHDVLERSIYGNDAHRWRRTAVTWRDRDVLGPRVGPFDVAHLGRFYRGLHWLLRSELLGEDPYDPAIAEGDTLPEKYSKYFVYP